MYWHPRAMFEAEHLPQVFLWFKTTCVFPNNMFDENRFCVCMKNFLFVDSLSHRTKKGYRSFCDADVFLPGEKSLERKDECCGYVLYRAKTNVQHANWIPLSEAKHAQLSLLLVSMLGRCSFCNHAMIMISSVTTILAPSYSRRALFYMFVSYSPWNRNFNFARFRFTLFSCICG